MQWAWLIPVFSFAAAPIIVLIGDRLPGKGAVLSIAAIGAGFAFFWIALFGWMGASDIHRALHGHRHRHRGAHLQLRSHLVQRRASRPSRQRRRSLGASSLTR